MSSNLPAKAWQLAERRQFREIRYDLPPPPLGWVRVSFSYCGICGSDLSKFESQSALARPLSLGHEFVAIVESVGEGVEHLKRGNVVVSDLNYRCGRCAQCKANRTHLCVEGQSSRFTNRAFATAANLDSSYLVPIAVTGEISRFVLCEPLSCVLYAIDWAVREPSETILVLGAGGLGLCAALAVGELDLQQPVHFWDPCGVRLQALPKHAKYSQLSDGPASNTYDVVVDLSGSVEGLELACASVKRGGRLCSMSHLDGQDGLNFLLSKLTRTDVEFKVSYLNGPKSNLLRAARIVNDSWNNQFDKAIGVHSVQDLPTLLANRRKSPFSKDVIDIKPWAEDLLVS